MTLASVRARTRLAAFVSLSLLLAPACARREAPSSEGAPPLPKDAVVVKVSYGSEKKGFLTDSIEAFHASNPRTAAGKPIRIEAVAEGSAESMEAILAGQSDVHVWSPASSLLVDVLNARWAEMEGLGGGKALVGEAPPLVLSPVVVAMWKPMAEALGWPGKPLGWSDLASLASSKEGWTKYGKPQWGEFKLGHTHPRFSNSGGVALVAATYAGAGKTRDLTLEDTTKASPFVKQVQSSIVHYGRSTGFFAEKMLTRGPAYLSAAVLYESNVAESYIDPKYKDRPFDVIAIYPKEGTFWADHPWAVLDLPTVSPEIREAAEAFRKYLMSTERQQTALTRFGFRPADTSIPLGAPIDASHGLDPAQPKNVLPNPPVDVTRRILDSFESVKRPVAITFVLDTSGSMKGEAFRQAQAGARTFLESLPAEDFVRVLLFSSETRWLSQGYGRLGEARAPLALAIDESFAGGGTALYDAVLKALEPAEGAPEGAIRAVVVLTDGEDTDSRTRLDAVLADLRRQTGSGEEEGSRAGASPPRLTGEGLSFERRQRFAEIQSLAAVIERSYARLSEVSQPLLLEQRAKLDQLLGNALSHLKALEAFEDLGAVKAAPETLAPEIAELERRIADPSTSEALRQRLRDGKDYKVRLAESMARGRERREVLLAELETLETALKILAQESAALLAPGEVAARLDELVAGAEATGETVREIEELSRLGEASQRQRATLLQ